ncbi:MAG: hypothetical protein ACR2PG_25910 [Hyphomicrobiaceae bacterium]
MANKDSFTPEEWKTVLASPMLASTAVTLADPSGIWGTIQEGMASARAVIDAKSDPGANELIQAVGSEYQTSEGRGVAQEELKSALSGKSSAELKAQVLEQLSEASQILDSKASSDASDFKAWLEGVAQRVSEAATEGGFLGFGGVKVSDAEKASISEIARVLRSA